MNPAVLRALALASVVGYGGGGDVQTGLPSGASDAANTEFSSSSATNTAGTLNRGMSPAVSTAAGASNPAVMPAGPVINANPSNYLSLVKSLQPGDTLLLEPGDYDTAGEVPGLPLFNLNGTPSKPIMITGPESGPSPRLLGRSSHNTIRLSRSSYLIIRNLEIDGRNLGGAGVAAQGSNHDITLENLYIHGVGDGQQTVGISTVSAPNWNWTMRGNTIVGAGTGMYLGNSDGENAFIAGLIENNLVRDTIGYNLQVKHQNPRPALPGMPPGKSVTVIRRNVFSKSSNSSTGAYARPNVLVGHFPTSGPGTDDHYEIYGNFFWQNPTEALFQGEGNVALYANVMVNGIGPGINIQHHHDVPKTVRIFGNTVIAKASGIRISGGHAQYVQRVEGNAVFSDSPVSADDQRENVVAGYDQAIDYLNDPIAAIDRFDAFPKAGTLTGAAIDAASISIFGGWDRDFNGTSRNWSIRGAYSGEGTNPGWKPALTSR